VLNHYEKHNEIQNDTVQTQISCRRQFVSGYLHMLHHFHTISVDIHRSQMAAQCLILCHLKNMDLNSFIVLLKKEGST